MNETIGLLVKLVAKSESAVGDLCQVVQYDECAMLPTQSHCVNSI